MSYYISDSFDLGMVTDYDLPCVSVTRVDDRYANNIIKSNKCCSAVRDEAVARAIGVERSDVCFTLQRGDDLLVAQPYGDSFRWLLVSLEEYDLHAALSWFYGRGQRLTRVWPETRGDSIFFIKALKDYDPYAIGVTLGIIAKTPMGNPAAHDYDCILGRLKAAWDDATTCCSGAEVAEFRQAVRDGFLAVCREIGAGSPIEALNDCLDHAGIDYKFAS